MSSQKGNSQRTRGQKHQNHTAWKSNATNPILSQRLVNTDDTCTRCREVIEWKIKYNKYKPLTKPKKCTKCEGKNVKIAYHILCENCASSLGLCAKCGKVEINTEKNEEDE